MTAANPTRYAELRARILAQLTEQRHADAERHSEARAGGNENRRTLDALGPDSLAFWTRVHREDRAADYAGQPATMPGPIMAAASAAQQTRSTEQ